MHFVILPIKLALATSVSATSQWKTFYPITAMTEHVFLLGNCARASALAVTVVVTAKYWMWYEGRVYQ